MGKGEDDTGIMAGSAVFICMLVCMCLCGLPMLVGGAVMLAQFHMATTPFTVGIVIVVLSVLFLVAGTVIGILLCTGKVGSARNTQANATSMTTTTTVTGPGQPMGQPGYPPGGVQPGYPPGGVQPVPQQPGYPPGSYPPGPYPPAGPYPAASPQGMPQAPFHPPPQPASAPQGEYGQPPPYGQVTEKS